MAGNKLWWFCGKKGEGGRPMVGSVAVLREEGGRGSGGGLVVVQQGFKSTSTWPPPPPPRQHARKGQFIVQI
jgi:hypothetical protein